MKFKDHVSLRNYQIPVDDRNKFMDSLFADMEKQKDESDVVNGLQVRITATHAARVTGHYHFYSPAKMKKGIDSFTSPFPKPVLGHHDEQKDAMGRVQMSSYIPTPHQLIPVSIIDAAEKDVEHSKKNLAYVDKLMPFLKDSRFEGLGYTSLLANVTDEDAIKKVINGIYHTVSVGYSTDSLHCSICKQDLLSEGPCEHKKGSEYKGALAFLIFGNLGYDEVSFVNRPADELAFVVGKKRIAVPVTFDLKDADNMRDAVIEAYSKDNNYIDSMERVQSTDTKLYVYDIESQSYKPIFLNQTNGDTMKITNLGTGYDFYKKLIEFLGEDKALDEKAFGELEDSVFAGPDRTFPAVDINHVEACIKLLDSVEDESKEQYMSFLNERKDSLLREEVIETADSNTEPEEVQAQPVTSKDEVSYSFMIRAEGGPWCDPEKEDKETEIAILNLLLSKYQKDFFAREDSFSNITSEDALFLVTKLQDKFQLSKEKDEKILQLTSELDNIKNQYNFAIESRKAADAVNAVLSKKLKVNLIDKILSMRRVQDPSESVDTLKAKLEGESLSKLENFFEVHDMVTPQASTEVIPTTEENVSHSIDAAPEESYTEDEIAKMKANVDKKYIELRRTTNEQAASAYKAKALDSISKLVIKTNN